MSYENAPATQMLATFCACCARPLLDAVSVETGVGPECRKKHGYVAAQGEPNWRAVFEATDGLVPVRDLLGGDDVPVTDAALAADAAWRLGGLETRRVANLLVHRIAVEQDGDAVIQLTNAVRALGFEKLAARVAKRLVAIVIEEGGAELEVRCPYSETFLALSRTIPGRRWDAAAKTTRFPAARKRDVWTAICRAYPGATGAGPKGLFVVPAAA
jgi:hypothetical protein